jgi:hypothetical protein
VCWSQALLLGRALLPQVRFAQFQAARVCSGHLCRIAGCAFMQT